MILGLNPRSLHGLTPNFRSAADVISSEDVEAAAQSSKGLAAGHSHGAKDALASAGADASHCIRTGWEPSPWWMAKLRVCHALIDSGEERQHDDGIRPTIGSRATHHEDTEAQSLTQPGVA